MTNVLCSCCFPARLTPPSSTSHSFPLRSDNPHCAQVWYAAENEEVSAKLTGALEGEEREKLWQGQKEVLASMEAAEAGGVEGTATIGLNGGIEASGNPGDNVA